MNSNFRVERLWYPAGEGTATVDACTYFLSMADSQGVDIEWIAGDRQKRRRSRVFSGDTWVLPPGQTWWARREAGKYCIQLSLSLEWLRQVTQSSFVLQPQVQLRDALLTQMLRSLSASAEVVPQNPTTQLYQESLAATLMLHLVTHYGQSAGLLNGVAPLSSTRLRLISNYIVEHLAETISLTDLANLVGLSASQFSLRFRETTGQTPHQFVTSLRVERARELLTAGRHTLADVALLTGFADQSHLTRHFRRSLGVTPGELKRQ